MSTINAYKRNIIDDEVFDKQLDVCRRLQSNWVCACHPVDMYEQRELNGYSTILTMIIDCELKKVRHE